MEATEIIGLNGVPIARRDLNERLHGIATGVVDQHVDRAELAYGNVEETLDVFFLADIRLHRDSGKAEFARVRDHRFGAVAAGAVTRDQGGAGFGETASDPAADTAAGAGHYCHLAVKIQQRRGRGESA